MDAGCSPLHERRDEDLEPRRTVIVRGIFWSGLYGFRVTFPLLAAVLAAPRGGSPSFLANVAVGAAYLALAMMALGMTPRASAPTGAPPVPHETTGAHANCRDCHAPGGGATALPATHRSFRDDTCLTCHRAAR
jgi:hypothetical protein